MRACPPFEAQGKEDAGASDADEGHSQEWPCHKRGKGDR